MSIAANETEVFDSLHALLSLACIYAEKVQAAIPHNAVILL